MDYNSITYEYLYNNDDRFRTLCIQYEYAVETNDDEMMSELDSELFNTYNVSVTKEAI